MTENSSSKSVFKSAHDKPDNLQLRTSQIEKLPYVVPELSRFGDVRDVTLAGSLSGLDSNGNMV